MDLKKAKIAGTVSEKEICDFIRKVCDADGAAYANDTQITIVKTFLKKHSRRARDSERRSVAALLSQEHASAMSKLQMAYRILCSYGRLPKVNRTTRDFERIIAQRVKEEREWREGRR